MSGVKKKQLPKLDLVSTDKLVVYDAIAGDHFGEYDDKILIIGKVIISALRYLRLCYDYTFTTDYQVKKYKGPPLINRLKLNYDPLNPEQYYVFHEIYKKFKIIPQQAQPKLLTLLQIGTNYGLIEYLAQTESRYKDATYIGTNFKPEKIDMITQDTRSAMIRKNIDANITIMPSDIYELLGFDIEPVDIYAYDNIEFPAHFQLMFSHTHTISNIIGIISGLRYTKPGGTFIIHMQSLINKTNADLYLLAKQYFDSSKLYMPECVNAFKQSGTWAVFTGFRGIPDTEYKHLLDIVAQIKSHYPNGVHDTQVYDPEVLKKCWLNGKYFSTATKHIPYITGFFDYKLDDSMYREIIAFNNRIYTRKLAFCKKVIKAMDTIKYPEHYNMPTPTQVKKSAQYLTKWGIGFELNNTSSSKSGNKPYTYLILSDSFPKESVDDIFTARGNWVPYTDKTFKKTVDFLYIDGKNIDNKEYYKIKSNLKSLVGDSKHAIVYKNNLYSNLLKLHGASFFLPVTVPFSIRGTSINYLFRFRSYFKPGRPYMCKVVKGGSGKGIITTDNYDAFMAFMRPYYNRMRSNPETFKQYEWVLQEYIANPWLVDGKKMHLRQNMIYQPAKDKPSYYMYIGEFALAEKPYVRGNWENKAIHDTHFHNGVGYYWPFDMNFTMEQWQKVKGQFDFIYACILDIMKNKGECYSDSKNCFELFGLDFMITDDLRVKLIEVNARVGLSPDKQFITGILDSTMSYVVDSYFPPKYAVQKYLNYIPIKSLVSVRSKIKSLKTKKRNSSIYNFVNPGLKS